MGGGKLEKAERSVRACQKYKHCARVTEGKKVGSKSVQIVAQL